MATKPTPSKGTYPDAAWDLETTDTDPTAITLSIGVYLFDRENEEAQADKKNRSFYAVLDINDQEENGRTISEDTMKWWAKQSPAAREVFNTVGEAPLKVLKRLNKFLATHGVLRLWGNGAAFDNAIMRDLYSTYSVEYPIAYWNDRCVRTTKDDAEARASRQGRVLRPVRFGGVKHHALDDAINEALLVQHCRSVLVGGA